MAHTLLWQTNKQTNKQRVLWLIPTRDKQTKNGYYGTIFFNKIDNMYHFQKLTFHMCVLDVWDIPLTLVEYLSLRMDCGRSSLTQLHHFAGTWQQDGQANCYTGNSTTKYMLTLINGQRMKQLHGHKNSHLSLTFTPLKLSLKAFLFHSAYCNCRS